MTEDSPNFDPDGQAAAPLVSVVITNFNYGRFVESAVRSVMAQTYRRWECVIVDDCSTDGSLELIRACLVSIGDDRFRCFSTGANGGQLAASLMGLRTTSGSFVVFLDADDYLLPDFIGVHVRSHLNSAFSAAMTSSDMLLVDADGSVLEGTHAGPSKNRLDPAGGVPDSEIPELTDDGALQYRNSFSVKYIQRHHSPSFSATSALMFRRSMLELIAPSESEFGRLHADYYLALFAHLISGTLVISSFHSAYRIHGGNGFSKPLLGGGNFVGVFDDSKRIAIERAISNYAIDNYASLSQRVQPYILNDIASRYLKRWEIQERSRNVPAARPVFNRGGPLESRLRALYNKLRKR